MIRKGAGAALVALWLAPAPGAAQDDPLADTIPPPAVSVVTFDGSFGGAPGPADAIPDPDGMGQEFQIDFCPSCDAATLPSGSHGRLVGTALLQSLAQMDLATDDAANFTASEGVTVDTVLARFTGGDRSEIFGAVRSDLDADVFLLNPNGFIFGETAALDVNGSFYASSADELVLEEDTMREVFEARAGGAFPLLVDTPASFGFWVDSDPPAAVKLQRASELRVTGGTFSIAAGRVRIEGREGISSLPSIEATGGGVVQLAAVSAGTELDLDFSQHDVTGLGDDASVEVTRGAILEARGRSAEGPGRILIRGGRFEMERPQGVARSGRLSVSETDSLEGEPPGIDVEVAGRLRLEAGVIQAGAGTGEIRLKGETVELVEGTLVQSTISDLFDTLDAPDIHVTADDTVEILDGSLVRTFDELEFGTATGSVADITVRGRQVRVEGRGSMGLVSEISSEVAGTGDGSRIVVEATERLEVADGARIRAQRAQSLFPGEVPDDLGVIEVKTAQLVVSDEAEIRSDTSSELGGADILVGSKAAPVDVLNLDAGIIGSTTAMPASAIPMPGSGSGSAGNVIVHAGSITIAGSPDLLDVTPQISSLSARGATGAGGSVEIFAGSLTLESGGQVRASTEGAGQGGALTVTLDGDLVVRGRAVDSQGTPRPSGVFARSGLPSVGSGPTTGDGGNLEVTAADVRVEDGALISATTESEGAAGEVSVTADSISVTGAVEPDGDVVESQISSVGNVGDGGLVEIRTGSLHLSNGGQVRASAVLTGDGGDVLVAAREIDIDGGDLDVGTGIFATSRLSGAGAGDAGRVTLAPPDGERLTLGIRDGGEVSVRALFSGAGGDVEIRDADVIELSDAEIIAQVRNPVLGPGEDPVDLAADVRILDAGLVMLSEGSSINAETQGTGVGGRIQIEADRLDLSSFSEISSRSTSPLDSAGDAGSIVIAAKDRVDVRDSFITTDAPNAGGGRISMQAANQITLTDTLVETSALSADAAKDAGDIDIPLRGDDAPGLPPVTPRVLIVNRSTIRANAVAADAGNISIGGGDTLISTTSVIEATSELGVDGVVDIRNRLPELAAAVTPLDTEYEDPSKRLLPPCAARTERTGSFVVEGRPPASSPDAPLSPSLVDGSNPSAPRWSDPAAGCPVLEETR